MGKREKKRPRERIIRGRIVALAIVLAVFISFLAGWKLVVHKPSLAVQSGDTDPQSTEDPAILLSGDRKKDFFTFLVIGRDSGGGGNTDTMMVIAYDVPNQSVNILNIYRDTMVNVSWDIKRINSVYNVLGIDGLKEHIGKLLGFVPDYYVKVELEAFGELVDAIGGVDFEVPYNMNYDDPTQNLHIHFQKGMQHLSGDDAMRVIRWRKNNDGSGVSVGDIGRVQIQQKFITALAEQCLKIGNITKAGEFARIFQENVDSDLTLGEMIWFGQKALGVDTENIVFHTLPGNYNGSAWSRTYHNYQSYVLPDADEIVKLVNEYLNPYDTEVTADMLDIMSVNSDGSLSSSSGKLADAKAGSAPVTTTKKSQTTAEPEQEETDTTPVTEEPATSPAAEEPATSPAAEEPAASPAPEESVAPEEEQEAEETTTGEPAATPTPDNLLPAMPVPADT